PCQLSVLYSFPTRRSSDLGIHSSMKPHRIAFVLVMAMLMLSARAYSQTEKSAKNTPASVNAFLGRWDLTLQAPDREYPSWLELRDRKSTRLNSSHVSISYA